MSPECHRGASYAQKGQHEEAIADFSKAIEIEPRRAPLYDGRGKVYQMIGDEARAEADFKRAAELDPENFGKP